MRFAEVGLTMASYHLAVSIIKRSSGRSATAAAAYRAAERIDDVRSGESHDYTRKGGVLETAILAPAFAPDWVHDRATLWNTVEHVEKRKDAQVAREITLALPRELSPEDRRALVETWAQDRLVSRGMVADVAIHAPHREGDNDNHHAHILITTREIDPEGFGKKNREWNDKALVEEWRESWAEAQNRALERSGFAERVDHRSLDVQREEAERLAREASERGEIEEAERQTDRAASLDRPPEPRLGPALMAIERKARRVAREEGREYEPVTGLGMALEESRAQRSMLAEARERVETARLAYEKAREDGEGRSSAARAGLAALVDRGRSKATGASQGGDGVSGRVGSVETADGAGGGFKGAGNAPSEQERTAPEKGRSSDPDTAAIIRALRQKRQREREDRERGVDRDRD